MRYAALGDSLSAGIGDPVDDGGWRGWAALLGASLGDGDPRGTGGGAVDGAADRAGDRAGEELGERGAFFRNFAVSGALTRDVEEEQTPEAIAFAPHLASVLVGVNDTLRCSFDIHDLAARLDRICAALAAHGTVLLTACLPDPGAMLGLPAPLARPLARRQRAVNAVVHALAERYDTVHLHLADSAWVDDRALWSADRLHPGERGHRLMAARFHAALTERGFALGAPPRLDPDRPPPTRAESLRWLATKGTAWVARRCRDLLPDLLRMAGAEATYWARGSSARLDLRAELALSTALAAISAAPPAPAAD
ncbi:SGNH/GDSL hydrolase family protein [Streptomyces sp. NPDC093085]|uniref:SGNH/GDSL hydrolase family protein n=1 Tax=Streptomyces sp. NPDC093085 TaxID=3155068 RepID=UPI0034266B54